MLKKWYSANLSLVQILQLMKNHKTHDFEGKTSHNMDQHHSEQKNNVHVNLTLALLIAEATYFGQQGES